MDPRSIRDFLFPVLGSKRVLRTVPAACKKTGDENLHRNVGFMRTLNIPNFHPSNVELVIDDEGKLIVKGKQVMKKENGLYSSSDIKEFNQELELPKNINEEELSLHIDRNGYLVIKAPLMSKEEKLEPSELQKSETIKSDSKNTSKMGLAQNSDRVVDNVRISSVANGRLGAIGEDHADQASADNDKAFVRKFDASGFKPEDIALAVDENGRLVVTAKKVTTQEKGNYKSSDTKEFKKYIDLPANVIAEEIKASMEVDGTLVIETPIMTSK